MRIRLGITPYEVSILKRALKEYGQKKSDKVKNICEDICHLVERQERQEGKEDE